MRAIIATNPEGKEFLYRSIIEFREEHKASPPTIDRALKRGTAIKMGKLKGWSFKYLSNPAKIVLDVAKISKQNGLNILDTQANQE